MRKTKIKVCGLMHADDARFCAELGIDMLGLNFSPQSARCLDRQKAREILSAVRTDFATVKFIGLFVDQPLDFVQKTIDELTLEGVQLHGNETPEFVSRIRSPFRIKALRVGSDFCLTPKAFASEASAYDCDALLLDTWDAERAGGTGKTFDWSIAEKFKSQAPRLILAGGLTPENVAEAIRMVEPFGVDVCSGVENSPGRKDADKLRRFVEAVRRKNEAAIAT